MVLNLTPDHLERHKTMRNYAVAKCRVFSQMRDNKIGILPLGTNQTGFNLILTFPFGSVCVMCHSGELISTNLLLIFLCIFVTYGSNFISFLREWRSVVGC